MIVTGLSRLIGWLTQLSSIVARWTPEWRGGRP